MSANPKSARNIELLIAIFGKAGTNSAVHSAVIENVLSVCDKMGNKHLVFRPHSKI